MNETLLVLGIVTALLAALAAYYAHEAARVAVEPGVYAEMNAAMDPSGLVVTLRFDRDLDRVDVSHVARQVLHPGMGPSFGDLVPHEARPHVLATSSVTEFTADGRAIIRPVELGRAYSMTAHIQHGPPGGEVLIPILVRSRRRLFRWRKLLLLRVNDPIWGR